MERECTAGCERHSVSRGGRLAVLFLTPPRGDPGTGPREASPLLSVARRASLLPAGVAGAMGVGGGAPAGSHSSLGRGRASGDDGQCGCQRLPQRRGCDNSIQASRRRITASGWRSSLKSRSVNVVMTVKNKIFPCKIKCHF